MRADQAAARLLSWRPLLLSTLPDFLTSPLNALAAVIPLDEETAPALRPAEAARVGPRLGGLPANVRTSESLCRVYRFVPTEFAVPDQTTVEPPELAAFFISVADASG
jgi:hypothetical protein